MHNNVVFIFDIDSTVANTDKRASLLKDVCVVCLDEVIAMESAKDSRNSQSYCPTCRSHVESKIPQGSWDSFCDPDNFDMDTPYPTAIKLINRLRKQGNHVHYITGRNETGREQTEAWLAKHIDRWEVGSRERVIMRPVTMRNVQASVYKRNAFVNFKDEMNFPEETTFFFFEDDEYVFPVYAEYGIVVKCPDAWDSILPDGNTSEEPVWRR